MDGLIMEPEMLDSFLHSLKDRKPGTVAAYRRRLEQFYQRLPEDKLVSQDTVAGIAAEMKEAGYSSQTVNTFLTAVNGFLGYYQRRDLQFTDRMEVPSNIQPELTRSEYLRLLSAARQLGSQKKYLLIKTFAVTGITIAEVEGVTVEAVKRGFLKRGPELITIPECVQEELLEYCKDSGIQRGPVFVNAQGKAMTRTAITVGIKRLARDARVDEEKCNPLCLRKLYQSTQENIMSGLRLMAQREHERLLEREQLQIGWIGGTDGKADAKAVV